MMHLEWLVQLCLMWHAVKIIKTRGEMLSKENIFQLQKHPAANRYHVGDTMKNIPKLCYEYNDTHDDETVMGTLTYASNTYNKNNNNTAEILNIFTHILQQIQNRECEQMEQKGGDFHLVAQQRQPKEHDSQHEGQPFSILQQLRLDEQKQKWHEEKQKQQLKLQEQQNALELQQILQHINVESLGKADKRKKKKKKKKKKKRKKKKKPVKDKQKKRKPIKQGSSLFAHPAQILFASPTQKPLHHYHQHHDDDHQTATTNKPFLQHPLMPIKKIKYILRKNSIFKKKKKEYLNHLKHVLYPFVKFIAFFTIINPFTLAVFIFSLVSPVALGFLGFIGLSFFIKPALKFLFGIKYTVDAIERRKLQQLRRRQRLRDSRRPITIHKHYYQQTPIAHPPPAHHHHKSRPLPPALRPKSPLLHSPPHRIPHPRIRQTNLFNPLLPGVRQKLKKDKYSTPNIKGQNDSFEQF